MIISKSIHVVADGIISFFMAELYPILYIYIYIYKMGYIYNGIYIYITGYMSQKASDIEKKMASKDFCTKKSHFLFSGKVLLGLPLQHRGVRPKKFPLLALSLMEKKVCSLYGVKVGL